MTNKRNPVFIMVLVAIITLSAYFMHQTRTVETFGLATASKVIVIDPGHGGFDPGKKGINGEDEKHINLKIALKLRNYLQQSGAVVIMTRTTDDDADGIEGKGHKKADMNKRRLISDSSEADILVTVSYTHLRAHETVLDLVCRLLLEKKKIPYGHTHLRAALPCTAPTSCLRACLSGTSP